MFCFQCEQTAGGKGCNGVQGVCGKKAEVSNIQDDLIGTIIGLCDVVKTPNKEVTEAIVKALFTTITNVNFNTKFIQDEIDKLNSLKKVYGDFSKFDLSSIFQGDEDIKSLKSLILFGLKGVAAYAYHALVLGYTNSDVDAFFYKALSALKNETTKETLLPLVLETGKINLTCMELLDKANTETYGNPQPTEVTMKIEKGPFIVITGHDLLDLYKLLEQTKDSGVNVYTHGEMLIANAYPKLKEFKNLKGNFGTAWQNQQKEFDNIPAPILFTTNCLMPPKESYKDRVWTTEVVAFPEIRHIDENKDFSALIEQAKKLGGYKEDKILVGVNGGSKVLTGFSHSTVLSIADTIIDKIKAGDIKHFFLVGGCDGAKPGRNYFTEFVKQTPKDSIILTLACGKFRFNDLDLGSIDGIPRILDMGQCNDAFSAIKVAVALSKAFNTTVNELPLSMILSWYEQKAVAVLLTLLYLGIKNIYLGPTLPAFVSPNILNFLVENFNISPISTPEGDLKKILG